MKYINPPTRPLKPKKERRAEKTPEETQQENYATQRGRTIGILVVISLVLFMLLVLAIYSTMKGL